MELTDIPDLDGKSFALTGPMKIADPARVPLRGDLAHVRLAGRCFVPHYAVPMLHKVGDGGAQLLAASQGESGVLALLDAGTVFDVLDIAGNIAWGQVAAQGQDGLVGYILLEQLEAGA